MTTFAQPANDALAFLKKLGELVGSPELGPNRWPATNAPAGPVSRIMSRRDPKRVEQQGARKTMSSNRSDNRAKRRTR